jgi:hypothetical protein
VWRRIGSSSAGRWRKAEANTIGRLLTQDGQVACFRNAARHLEPGGVFVVECRIPAAPARPRHQFIDAEEVSAGRVVLGYASTTR